MWQHRADIALAKIEASNAALKICDVFPGG